MPMRTCDPPVSCTAPATDLSGLCALAAGYRAAGARQFVLIARASGYPAAVAVLDAPHVEPFLRRFFAEGIPAPWHAGTWVRVTVHGLDPTDADTAREVAGISRGRWCWASDREAGRPFVDASMTPPRGAARAERRRQARTA
jgi:hypothetical protein